MKIENNEEHIKKEKRGYLWKCTIIADKEQFVANPNVVKQPCGYWNYYYGSKRPEGKQVKWQSRCQNCGRKRQLNLDNILPRPPNYYNKRKAIEQARRLNESKKIISKEDSE